MSPPDLLHSALNRAAHQAAESETGSPTRGRLSPPSLDGLSLSADPQAVFSGDGTKARNESEDDLIAVLTPFATPFASRNTSRSSSPTRRSNKGAGKPRRDKSKELAKSQANKLGADGTGSRDPLVRFENSVSGRIFAELGSEDLLACGGVCRKWRGSQTLNYTWYNLLQSLTYVDPTTLHGSTPVIPNTPAAFLLWTRRDSKIDWRARFASIYAPIVVEEGADELNEEGMTMKEEREERWREENEGLAREGEDKGAMREYYKNLGNSKVKGKSGKGSASTWTTSSQRSRIASGSYPHRIVRRRASLDQRHRSNSVNSAQYSLKLAVEKERKSMAPPNSPPNPNPSSINPTFRSSVRAALPPRQPLDAALFGLFDVEATAARARVHASEESRRIIEGNTPTSNARLPTLLRAPGETAASGSNRVHMSGRRRTLSNGLKQITTKPFPLPTYLLHSTRSDRYSTVPLSDHVTLPVSWNPEDAAALLTVSSDGLRVSFNGQGRQTDRDAASVRTAAPISQETPFFYYETEIVSSGQSGYIAVGLSKNSVSLQRLVGWDPDSWGYHGDDGRAFCSKGYGEVFGPTYTRGDVIGCGMDWTGSHPSGSGGGEGRVFFVKNGIFVGYAFSGLTGELYPSVGLRTVGEIVRSNFGAEPFKFDIDGFVLGRKQAILAAISKTILSPPFLIPASPSPSSSTTKQSDRVQATIQDLIASYLNHHSYSSTAASFSNQIQEERAEVSAGCYFPPSSMSTRAAEPMEVEMATTSSKGNSRGEIRAAILVGDAARALELLSTNFPRVLTQDLELDPAGGIRLKLQLRIFVESLLTMRNISQPRGKGKRKKDENEAMEDLEMDDHSSSSSSSSALDDLLQLGRTIDAENAADQRPAVKEALSLTFSLLAYDSPEDRGLGGKIGYLLSEQARVDLADEVNSAILISQSLPPRPHLETLYRHAAAAIELLADEGVGSAALVDIRAGILGTK